jgi:uncharacterized protein YoxC
MNHEKRIRENLNQFMNVKDINPQATQVTRQVARDVFNRSYIVWAFTMLALVAFSGAMYGSFTTKLEEVNSTMNDVKAQQRVMMVYFNKLNESKKENE